jgi:hypothetical protein
VAALARLVSKQKIRRGPQKGLRASWQLGPGALNAALYLDELDRAVTNDIST